ncbi:MAG: hypothetical protein DMF37_11315 [Verrucomicrobia bacterium]|nr:MAG: hypothetical protein DMF37_11315 [Verrucomicrobiota bacterium]
MFRRSPRSTSPLRRRQEQIARQEAELRERLEKLERMVANGPRRAEDTSPAPREEPRIRDNTGDTQLRVSVALQDRHYFDKSGSTRRPRSLRKERREGRMIFLLLVIALAAAIIWLMSHLHF